MLKIEQLMEMLGMQASMNSKVNPRWVEAGYPFLRAIVIEGAEAIDHTDWKWWKAQKPNLPQLQMEVVDIWHFALSAELVANESDAFRAARGMLAELADAGDRLVFDDETYVISELDLVRKLEIMIGLAAVRRFSLSLFRGVLADCGMTWEDLYRQYVGKNTLNFFRQDHGYKAGTYEKTWNGREDNEHLVEILAAEDSAAEDFRNRIYAGLLARYQQPVDAPAN